MKIKKIFCMFIILALVFSISGCAGTQKPEDTVSEFLGAAQNFDIEKMKTYINTDDAGDLSKFDSNDESVKDFYDYLKECASKMTYNIKSSDVKDDTATVTVDFKYIDSTPFIQAVIKEVFTQALSSAFSGQEMTDEQTNALFANIIKEQKSKIEDKYVEETIDIKCVKVNGKWLIDSDDSLANVLTANFVSVIKNISSSFNNSGADSSSSSLNN
ncbi:MAG: DUF5105 domain-containing protein [Clostridia bacterium]|nr:DUF5105 domain-containing protein [Clostridia bacterium]